MERMIRIPAYRVRLERWVWIAIGMVIGVMLGVLLAIGQVCRP